MNQMWNLVKKELRELLTPASLASVIAVCVILIVLGSVVGGQVQSNTELKPIGLIDETEAHEDIQYSDSGMLALYAYYQSQIDEQKIKNKTPEDYIIVIHLDKTKDKYDGILEAMNENKLETAVLIPDNFNSKMKEFLDYIRPTEEDPIINTDLLPKFQLYYNQSSTSVFSALSTVTGFNAVAQMSKGVQYKVAFDYNLKEDQVAKIFSSPQNENTTFFKGVVHTGTLPSDITGAISSQTVFVPIIIMLIIVMIGSILISSMGNEKENKTLETLLTLPISRTKVVAGKILGCAIAGLVMGAIYMAGMYFYISGFTSAASGGKSLSELGLALNGLDWVIVAFFMFMAIMCALGMCMILGAFAKNYKAAQTYVMPISVLAVIPMFVTMFSDFSALPAVVQGILFLIPFTHPMMIINNLMFGNIAMVAAGAIYLVVFAALMIYITVRIYNSDILLTGWNQGDDKKKGKSPLSVLFARFQKS